jgi:hypothetical protein
MQCEGRTLKSVHARCAALRSDVVFGGLRWTADVGVGSAPNRDPCAASLGLRAGRRETLPNCTRPLVHEAKHQFRHLG